jgi:hypothetical protein
MDDLIRIVFLSALAFNGMLAGMSLDQGIKQLPARKRIGPAAYAQYTRAADLGPGVTLYSVFGIGAALLVLALSYLAWRAGDALDSYLRVAVYVAAVFAVLHSAATMQAAPIMFSQRQYSLTDEAALIRTFDRFAFWHTLRCGFQVASFLTLLCATWVGMR